MAQPCGGKPGAAQRLYADDCLHYLFLGMLMLSIQWKKFLHPVGVYRLEYPDHWENLQKDEARSCGFGPFDRDDVGLWISVLPYSVDTERLAEELPKILNQVLPNMKGGDARRDPTLRHFGVKADVHREGEGGHYWLIAGGDVVLFASSQVPAAERHIWNPHFEQVMASLVITRDEELALLKLTGEVLEMLRQRHPDQEFQIDEKGIRGRNRVVFLSNLYKEVRAAPASRDKIIQHFVDSLGQSMDLPMGEESWDDAQTRMLPLLKPRSYLESDFANRSLLVNEWLADVVICYALRSNEVFRFVTTWDAGRWQTDAQAIHELAVTNLCAWLAEEAGRGWAPGLGASDRHHNQRRVGVEPTAPSRPAPDVLRPAGKSIQGRHSGSRYSCCLFRAGPPQKADRAAIAQGSSHVGLSHYLPALSRNARRCCAGFGLIHDKIDFMQCLQLVRGCGCRARGISLPEQRAASTAEAADRCRSG